MPFIILIILSGAAAVFAKPVIPYPPEGSVSVPAVPANIKPPKAADTSNITNPNVFPEVRRFVPYEPGKSDPGSQKVETPYNTEAPKLAEIEPLISKAAKARAETQMLTSAPAARPRQFMRRSEMLQRSSVFAVPIVPAPFQTVNEQSLSLDTVRRETENDSLSVLYEYKNAVMVAEANLHLHALVEKNYRLAAVPEQDFEDSRTRLIRSQWKVQELKSLWEEYEAETAILGYKSEESKGNVIPLITMAKAYVDLWHARVGKFAAAREQASIDYHFYGLVLAKDNALWKNGKSITKQGVIEGQRDEKQARIVLELATKMAQQNQRFYEEALADVKWLETHGRK